MRNSTLCYIEKDGKYLMLHRTKKADDINEGKWIGVGGKIEEKESPNECVVREVMEETGLKLTGYKYRGIVTFASDTWDTEYMHLFTATEFLGEVNEDVCDEGELMWIPKDDLDKLNLWEGDKVFLKLLQEKEDFFSVKLRYEGEKLVESVVY